MSSNDSSPTSSSYADDDRRDNFHGRNYEKDDGLRFQNDDDVTGILTTYGQRHRTSTR